jgi:hypothetical protein
MTNIIDELNIKAEDANSLMRFHIVGIFISSLFIGASVLTILFVIVAYRKSKIVF